MHSLYDLVQRWHQVMENPVNLTQPSADLIRWRFDLVEEEFNELKEEVLAAKDVSLSSDQKQALLKEGVDLIWCVMGLMSLFGFDLDKAFAKVYDSNMSKLGADGKPLRNETGKIVKGPNYQKPDLSDCI